MLKLTLSFRGFKTEGFRQLPSCFLLYFCCPSQRYHSEWMMMISYIYATLLRSWIFRIYSVFTWQKEKVQVISFAHGADVWEEEDKQKRVDSFRQERTIYNREMRQDLICLVLNFACTYQNTSPAHDRREHCRPTLCFFIISDMRALRPTSYIKKLLPPASYSTEVQSFKFILEFIRWLNHELFLSQIPAIHSIHPR